MIQVNIYIIHSFLKCLYLFICFTVLIYLLDTIICFIKYLLLFICHVDVFTRMNFTISFHFMFYYNVSSYDIHTIMSYLMLLNYLLICHIFSLIFTYAISTRSFEQLNTTHSQRSQSLVRHRWKRRLRNMGRREMTAYSRIDYRQIILLFSVLIKQHSVHCINDMYTLLCFCCADGLTFYVL